MGRNNEYDITEVKWELTEVKWDSAEHKWDLTLIGTAYYLIVKVLLLH